MKKIFKEIIRFGDMLKYDNISAYSAHSAYFFILSFIPLIMLLMSLIRYTNISEEYMIQITIQFVPADMASLVTGIIKEMYAKSATTVSISALITLWSAGKGFAALKNGMNTAIHVKNKRSFILLRFSGMFDALVFMLIIVLALILGVFGQGIENLISSKIDIPDPVVMVVVQFRRLIMLSVFIAIFTISYMFIPDWRENKRIEKNKVNIFQMLPGAVVSAVGWHMYSSLFSFYLRFSKGFENMYGSLAAIIGIMLWFYGCMYLILAGFETNIYLIHLFKRIYLKKQ